MRNFHNVITALIVKPLSVLVNSKKWNIKVQISVTRHESVRLNSGGVRQHKQTQRKLFLGLLGFSINFHWIFVSLSGFLSCLACLLEECNKGCDPHKILSSAYEGRKKTVSILCPGSSALRTLTNQQ